MELAQYGLSSLRSFSADTVFEDLPDRWPNIDLHVLVGGLVLCLLSDSIQPRLPSRRLPNEKRWTFSSDFSSIWVVAMKEIDELFVYLADARMPRESSFYASFLNFWNAYTDSIIKNRDFLERRRFSKFVAKGWASHLSTTECTDPPYEPPVVLLETAFPHLFRLSQGSFLSNFNDHVCNELTTLPSRISIRVRSAASIVWGPSPDDSNWYVLHFLRCLCLFTVLLSQLRTCLSRCRGWNAIRFNP